MKQCKRNDTKSFKLTKRSMWQLWICQLANIFCLVQEISPWMLSILALLLCWQAFMYNQRNMPSERDKVSRVFIIIFAVTGCIAISITASNNGVLISMVNLVAFAYVLKAFEIKQRKDFYQLMLLGIFLLGAALIFKQNLGFSIAILLALILNLTILIQYFTQKLPIVTSVKTVSFLILQSSVLAIVLFIVFPRLSPFWQVPSAQSAQTGLSNEVSPGDIANLALSNDLAFRVDFNGSKIPEYSNLYWRAMTLENYDGRKWSRISSAKKGSSAKQVFSPNILGEKINYNIIVGPSYQSWLFALSVATSDDNKIRMIDDYTVQSCSIIGKVTRYQLTSYLNSPLDINISEDRKKNNLKIAINSNPRLEHFAQELIEKYADPIDRSNAVLALFREQEFFYTLKPPLLSNNSLDQFFFDTQAGFCVHYATTYTYIMRAAGIPARVVTGYLGGEYNKTSGSQNGHLSIYQYDAHAWTEIWLEGIGWQRVDPTAAVDPQRVNSGWSLELLNQQSSLNNNILGLYQLKKIEWLNSLRLKLDALDYQWTRWVLGYSNKQQYNLLKRWFGDYMYLKAILATLAILITLITLFYLFPRLYSYFYQRKEIPVWIKLYNQVLMKLSKKGVVKTDEMTASGFAKTVAMELPEISHEFNEFTQTFEHLLYKKIDKNQQQQYINKLKIQYVKLISIL